MNKTTLKNLVNRVVMDQKMLENNPQNADVIKKHKETAEKYIIECVLKNADNPLLEKISF